MGGVDWEVEEEQVIPPEFQRSLSYCDDAESTTSCSPLSSDVST